METPPKDAVRADASMVPSRRRVPPYVLLIGLLAALAALHAWLLLGYPAPFVDEAWHASRAIGLLHTGRSEGVLDVGIFGPFPIYRLHPDFLNTCVNAIGQFVAGGPSLVAMRVVALCHGLVLVAAVYLAGSRCVSPRVGLVAAALVGLSQPFLYSAHLGRPDTAASAFGYLAIATYFANTRKVPWRTFVSALLVGVSFELHPNGVVFGATLAALILFDEGRSVWRRPHAWAFVAGGVVSVCASAALHILPDPATYFAVSKLAYGKSHAPPLLRGDWGSIESAIGGFVQLLEGDFYALEVFLLVAIGSLATWRTSAENRLLVLATTVVAAFVLIVPNKFGYYSIVYSPALDLLLAAFLVRCIESARAKAPLIPIPLVLFAAGSLVPFFPRVLQTNAALVALTLLLILVGSLVRAFRKPVDAATADAADPEPGSREAKAVRLRRLGAAVACAAFAFAVYSSVGSHEFTTKAAYDDVVAKLAPSIREGDRIMAPQTYWFRFSDHPYFAWETLPFYDRYKTGASVADAFDAYRPDIFVIDNQNRGYIAATPRTDHFAEVLRIDEDQLDAFLAEHAELVDRFASFTYGQVEVFRIHWDVGAQVNR